MVTHICGKRASCLLSRLLRSLSHTSKTFLPSSPRTCASSFPVVRQFLESYKSVTLESMATAFDVSSSFLDGELVDFIVAGRLHARIDKVAGVIETNRWGAGGGLPVSTRFAFAIARAGRMHDPVNELRFVGWA